YHLDSAFLQENSEVTLLCLKWKILYRLFPALPDVVLIGRDGERVAGPDFNNVSALYLFLFLHTGRQIKPAVSLIGLFSRFDQHAVAHDNEISQLVVSRHFHSTRINNQR